MQVNITGWVCSRALMLYYKGEEEDEEGEVYFTNFAHKSGGSISSSFTYLHTTIISRGLMFRRLGGVSSRRRRAWCVAGLGGIAISSQQPGGGGAVVVAVVVVAAGPALTTVAIKTTTCRHQSPRSDQQRWWSSPPPPPSSPPPYSGYTLLGEHLSPD